MSLIADILPEEQLLISLCRLSFSEKQKKNINALVKKITDINRFVYLANEHGIIALVYDNLKETGAGDLLPEEKMVFLANSRMKSLGRNTFLYNIIEEVLGLFRQAKIKTVLLKGMALELSVYGNKGLRQMNDIDILVPRKRCMEARRILLKNGFQSIPLKSPLYNLILPYYGKHLPELVKGGISVEIHHNLFAGPDHSLTEKMITGSTEILFNKSSLYIPPVREFFLYLVKHLDKHEKKGESQLRLYTDLFCMIENYGEELLNRTLFKEAEAAGLEKILAAKLFLLKHYWGIFINPGLEIPINEKAPANITQLFKTFLSQPKGHPAQYSRAYTYRQTINQIQGLHRKIIFILGDLFPSLRFMRERYGTRSKLAALLYYPHRLGKIIYLIRMQRN
ncbi:MAG: nucleotidyltransferase family protein [Bacteroidales bacterium]|nr:nucleotidyltransferase family protein [Bacteroidales bacterium]